MRKERSAEEPTEVDAWNTEDEQDLELPTNLQKYAIIVSSRDWTVETMVQQIQTGNIDLDPAFQRRNAWRDPRRSRLIESFILGFPVPQLVLAENLRRKGKFIVIDGKQRLLTIAGLYLPQYRDYWTQPRFVGLNVLEDLNRVTIEDFLKKSEYANQRRQLANSDIRTTVVTGFQDESVLYDIFYRINTGSVPLSSQELRQAILSGPFSKYLLELTATENPIWTVLNIDEPDPRLRDVELMLRLLCWRRFARGYRGNMKAFLDDAMDYLNDNWKKEQGRIETLVAQIFRGVQATAKIFGEHAGRKALRVGYETSLNRALFEVQTYYFSFVEPRSRAMKNAKSVRLAFRSLSKSKTFIASIESTTKSIDNTRTRFEKVRRLLEDTLSIKIESPKIASKK
jgi:Protein of unknown function DUF262